MDATKFTIPVSTGLARSIICLTTSIMTLIKKIMILFKLGSGHSWSNGYSAPDRFRAVLSDNIQVDFRWVKCDSIEIVGTDLSSLSIEYVQV